MNTLEEVRDLAYRKQFDKARALLPSMPKQDRAIAETFLDEHQRGSVDFEVTLPYKGIDLKLRIQEEMYQTNGVTALVAYATEKTRLGKDDYVWPGEVWATLTANLPDQNPGPGTFFVKTWDKANALLRDLILKTGKLEKTVVRIPVSQWAEIEIWKVPKSS